MPYLYFFFFKKKKTALNYEKVYMCSPTISFSSIVVNNKTRPYCESAFFFRNH